MRTLIWAELEAQAADRPAGYIESILKVGAREGAFLRIAEEDFERIRAAFPGPTGPSLREMISNFAGALARWRKAGFTVVARETFQTRHLTCLECPNWSTDGLVARCAVCGCVRLKLWAASEACPIGKWKAVQPGCKPPAA